MGRVNATAQNMAALDLANRTRLRRAAIRRKLRQSPPLAAVDTALEILHAPEPMLATMPVRRLLEALPRYGPDRLRKVYASADGVPEQATLGQLTDRQRGVLAKAVRAHRPYRDREAMEGGEAKRPGGTPCPSCCYPVPDGHYPDCEAFTRWKAGR